MKDATVSSSKSSRPTAYPKKRPSPHPAGKSKSNAPAPIVHHSPHALKMQREQQRQREEQGADVGRREPIPPPEDEYREEFIINMHEMERTTMPSVSSMDQQPEIKWHMRPCLVEFLTELHFTFRLRPETLYLCMNIVDRYVSRRVVYIKHYQLVGCAALWIAAKFEDAKDRVPSVAELVHYCRDEYDESAFIQMEGHVLQTINWILGHPTAEGWLRLYFSDRPEDIEVQHVARFLMEVTLFYREFVKYPPSVIALGSLMLARHICGRRRRYYEETEEVLDVVDALDARLNKRVNDLSEALVKKYSFSFYSRAATTVVQFYLQGRRFDRTTPALTPLTPSRSTMSAFGTPMSTTTSASDLSDEMPMTPTSPAYANDPFASSVDDKENDHSSFDPVVHKSSDSATDQYLPHDFVTSVRPVLHTYNVSPRTMVA